MVVIYFQRKHSEVYEEASTANNLGETSNGSRSNMDGFVKNHKKYLLHDVRPKQINNALTLLFQIIVVRFL